MTFSPKTLTIMVLASLAINLLLLFLVAATRGNTRRGARPGGPGGDLLAATLDGQGRTLDRVEAAIRRLAAEANRLDGVLKTAVQHVAVVRFDAFEDMGGRLSFSAALLDASGDGMVITSINGRQDTRCYAKPVRRGTSPHNLSDEEEVAIREALGGARQTVEAR
ncbi:MAG: DUF4446 family protein [Actinobacteria bacterium]|nr:DUF4446 family protein [Actinomycetota bacterium]